MKKHFKKIIIGAITVFLLAFFYLWGGNAPAIHDADNKSQIDGCTYTSDAVNSAQALKEESAHLTADEKIKVAEQKAGSSDIAKEKGDESYSAEKGMKPSSENGKDKYDTSPVPAEKSVPSDRQSADITDKEHKCTLSVRCDTILSNISLLKPAKAELVPPNGVIYEKREVVFYEGESVFNVLVREMKKSKVHLEFVNTPVYKSAYIEGIGNLYEYDCGELSGWMYRVNGLFPNYGCSRYKLKQGDEIEWVYTCDLGADVGSHFKPGESQKDE